MGLCLYVDLCFHASSLPSLHTFWHDISLLLDTSLKFFLPSLHLFTFYICLQLLLQHFNLADMAEGESETAVLIAVGFEANLYIAALWLPKHTLITLQCLILAI